MATHKEWLLRAAGLLLASLTLVSLLWLGWALFHLVQTLESVVIEHGVLYEHQEEVCKPRMF